jgi:DNA-binding transcriptional regulator YdaS (Cro superfamily)
MVRELIERAIGIAGSQAKLADACGVTQQSVWQAKEAGRCSADLAVGIHRATAGAVPAYALRPDLFPEGFEPPRQQVNA